MFKLINVELNNNVKLIKINEEGEEEEEGGDSILEHEWTDDNDNVRRTEPITHAGSFDKLVLLREPQYNIIIMTQLTMTQLIMTN